MKPHLVIADDEADICRLIKFLLRSYELSEAQNGKRALELIREVQPPAQRRFNWPKPPTLI